ncbi:hypothetical protein N6G02_06110 [Cupriavidus gilardii]|uniref:hypothetical protein n=1 Tax=Cupriavidus gilardii TaxID=82541 RepID=UPI0021C21ECD|nr:hypothetical protein [Cupriavidus gilardii]MCT9115696.1 hypothetical protein [Cupriavidus gilardii]
MEEERLWKQAVETLERLRATLQKEMNDWAEIERRIDDLQLRATRDPKAAQELAALAAFLEASRNNGDDIQGRMEQLQAMIKEMNLRAAQDRREIERYKQKVFGAGGDEQQTAPVPPRAEGTAEKPKKRVRRFA